MGNNDDKKETFLPEYVVNTGLNSIRMSGHHSTVRKNKESVMINIKINSVVAKNIISVAAALLILSPVQASDVTASKQASQSRQHVIHNNGEHLYGLLIKKNNERFLGPISAIHLFSLKTEQCGILDFQASRAGLICTNCRENTAVLKTCHIPRSQVGWHLAENS